VDKLAAEDHNDQRSENNPTLVDHSVDELAKGLATGTLSRRKALKMLGAALVGGVLASIPGVAWAQPPSTAGGCRPQCPEGYTCTRVPPQQDEGVEPPSRRFPPTRGNPFLCCPTDNPEGLCCSAEQICSNGGCCPTGECMANGQCCEGTILPNGECCEGNVMSNGQCCPAERCYGISQRCDEFGNCTVHCEICCPEGSGCSVRDFICFCSGP
jgi:hypothetical protein